MAVMDESWTSIWYVPSEVWAALIVLIAVLEDVGSDRMGTV